MIGPDVDGFLIAQAAATLFMTGLIWFVQIVHYPLLKRVGVEAFAGYEEAHIRLTSWIVGPPMLIEVTTSLYMVFRLPAGVSAGQAWAGLALVAVIWISTATLQVSQHRRLANGFEPSAHRSLVLTNWIRVLGWSLRAALVLYWLS
jgi:uncharacterized membrane protein